MNIKSSKSLDSSQMLLLNKMEDDFSSYIKRKLNESENQLTVAVLLIVKDREKHNIEYSSNESFKIPGSKALDSYLKPYIEGMSISNDIAENYTLHWEVKYSEKKKGKTSENNEKMDMNENDKLPDFISTKPRFSFSQIILPQKVRDEIFDALNIITNKDLIYEDWGFNEVDSIPRSVLNFYGEPGTGKTMCAHAIANHLNKEIMCLNYSEIESKFVGEAPKNLKKAFDTAKEKDAVLFFDEADSFLGKRIQNVSQGADQALNSLRSQMLILLEQFDGVVLFATNLVTNFDKAFESRILKHIQFELPNKEARAAIIEKMLPSKIPFETALTKEQFMEASALIDGLSGREIKNAILEMLTHEANEHGKEAVFTYEKLSQALVDKKEMKRKLKEEKDKELKKKIEEKLKGVAAETKIKSTTKKKKKKKK